MSEFYSVPVMLPFNDNGSLGLKCPTCNKYFEIINYKDQNSLYCPYCKNKAESKDFFTPSQMEYLTKQVEYFFLKKIVHPELSKLKRVVQTANQNNRNSLLKITCELSLKGLSIPDFKDLDIENLQTKITCDNCETEFSVFGNFANCPICNNMNAFSSYKNSISITKKMLSLIRDKDLEEDLKRQIYSSSIEKCISHFDALGKELRKHKPDIFTAKSRNLFQNLYLVDSEINHYISNNHSNFEALLKMFQVRHLYVHNSGVIDADFIAKVPGYAKDIDKIYELEKEEVEMFITNMQELGFIMEKYYNQGE